MGKNGLNAREAEFERILSQLTTTEQEELYGVMLAKRWKKPALNFSEPARRWWFVEVGALAPIIIGQ